MQWILELTEENDIQSYSNYFGRALKRPHIFTIMTANKSILDKISDEKTKVALGTRIKEITFPPLNDDSKMKFAIKYLTDRAESENFDCKEMEKDLSHIVKSDDSGGVRAILRNIDRLITETHNREFFGDWQSLSDNQNKKNPDNLLSSHNKTLLFSDPDTPCQRSRQDIADIRTRRFAKCAVKGL